MTCTKLLSLPAPEIEVLSEIPVLKVEVFLVFGSSDVVVPVTGS